MKALLDYIAGGINRGIPQAACAAGVRMLHKGRQLLSLNDAKTVQAMERHHQKPQHLGEHTNIQHGRLTVLNLKKK